MLPCSHGARALLLDAVSLVLFHPGRSLAYVVMLAGTFAFLSQTGHLYETVPHFISAVAFASV